MAAKVGRGPAAGQRRMSYADQGLGWIVSGYHREIRTAGFTLIGLENRRSS